MKKMNIDSKNDNGLMIRKINKKIIVVLLVCLIALIMIPKLFGNEEKKSIKYELDTFSVVLEEGLTVKMAYESSFEQGIFMGQEYQFYSVNDKVLTILVGGIGDDENAEIITEFEFPSGKGYLIKSNLREYILLNTTKSNVYWEYYSAILESDFYNNEQLIEIAKTITVLEK